MVKLLKENETLKRHYKELSDSIKKTRAKTIEHTTSLITQNAEFKAPTSRKMILQLQHNNELRQLTGKSERPRISKPRFASQVDVNNDLPKPVTTHYLHRERESAFAKLHHMIAPSSSRYRSNDMVHNHYLAEAKKKTQERGRNIKTTVWMPSARVTKTQQMTKTLYIHNKRELCADASVSRPMYEEPRYRMQKSNVSKSFAPSDNLQQHDTQPTANIHPTSDPINPPTSVNAEENM
ncbi:hypothetical protein Tco_0570893 [Tanacetum coccineum]